MGGFGSGRPRTRTRGAVEHSTWVSIRGLRDLGQLRAGMFALQDGATFCVVTTTPHYGGLRYWFACGCGRRCTALFRALATGGGTLADLVRGYRLGCRRCARVSYRTQGMGEVDRLYLRAFALYERIGVDYSCHPRRATGKPPRMRWTTYERVWREAAALERRALRLHCDAYVRRFGDATVCPAA